MSLDPSADLRDALSGPERFTELNCIKLVVSVVDNQVLAPDKFG
jgi:hypothetical protein